MTEAYTAANISDLAYSIENRSVSASSAEPFMVNVCGVSASGKSTLSKKLSEQLRDGSLVTMDRYLSERLWDSTRQFNHDSPDPNRPYIGGISPDIWDIPLMSYQLKELKMGNSVDMPIFDERVKDRVGYEIFTPTTHIVVEGGHSFSSPFIELSQYKVLIDAPLHHRLIRKLFRTCVTYGLNEGDEVLERYLTKDEPVHRHYLEERMQIADAIICNLLDTKIEFSQLSDQNVLSRGKYHLVPQETIDNNDPTEKLLVDEVNGELMLMYFLEDRLIFSTSISHKTFDLMLQFYDQKEEDE